MPPNERATPAKAASAAAPFPPTTLPTDAGTRAVGAFRLQGKLPQWLRFVCGGSAGDAWPYPLFAFDLEPRDLTSHL